MAHFYKFLVLDVGLILIDVFGSKVFKARSLTTVANSLVIAGSGGQDLEGTVLDLRLDDAVSLMGFQWLYIHIPPTSALYRKYKIGATHQPVDA